MKSKSTTANTPLVNREPRAGFKDMQLLKIKILRILSIRLSKEQHHNVMQIIKERHQLNNQR